MFNVWVVESFRCYVNGVHLNVIPDHKISATILKRLKSREQFSGSLQCFAERSLPFDFDVIHGQSRTQGIFDFPYRNTAKSKTSGRL